MEYKELKNRGEDICLTPQQLDNFKRYIKQHRSDKVSELIDELFNATTLYNQSIKNVRKLYMNIVFSIVEVCYHKYIMQERNLFRDFDSFDCLSQLRIYLKQTVHDVIYASQRAGTDLTAIELATKYIRKNFHKNIDMAMVANMVSVSYTYFSKFFKKETGVTFSDYLKKIRMEEAKKLLADPTNRINEVCRMVGYDNPKYFTRLFRSYFGVSPSKYRKGYGKTDLDA